MNEKTFPSLGYKMPRSSHSQAKAKPVSHPPAVFQNPMSSVAHTTPSTPTFGQTLKEGLAFGAGSAIAHRLINPFPSFPSFPTKPLEQKAVESCEKERAAFETCMKTKSTDDFCGEYQISYTQCIRMSNPNPPQ
jgi:hypothetical protein